MVSLFLLGAVKLMRNLRFIDLFAGCGGLSLGLIKAGLEGTFAVEKNTDAFLTLKHNLFNVETQFD